MRRGRLGAGVVAALVAACVAIGTTSPAVAAPRGDWRDRLRHIIGNHPLSLVVGDDGHEWFAHDADIARIPASNEKLLLSMALLDRFGRHHRFTTGAVTSGRVTDGVLAGDLWLTGTGDPDIGTDQLDMLASRLVASGLRAVDGAVRGDTGPFVRDWMAVGWKPTFPVEYVPLPTALTFAGNVDADGVHIDDPEASAAAYLAHRLAELGVTVSDGTGVGLLPAGTHRLAGVHSARLPTILTSMNTYSRNFHAEVLSKALGVATTGTGDIRHGAAAICAFELAFDVTGTCHDGSGLSYANRQTVRGIVTMLWAADEHPWGHALRSSLALSGSGTLKGRMTSIRVRAKTGTLDEVSALSGWVWNVPTRSWIEFSMLTNGMDEYQAKVLEDRIARVLARRAAP